MIVDDHFAGVLEDRETMVDGLQQPYPLYQQLGLASVTHECLEAKELIPAHLAGPRPLDLPRRRRRVPVRQHRLLLRRDDDDLRACVCVQVDDAEKIQVLAAERGIDLTQFTSSSDA